MTWYTRRSSFKSSREELKLIKERISSLDNTALCYEDRSRESHKLITYVKTRDDKKDYIVRLQINTKSPSLFRWNDLDILVSNDRMDLGDIIYKSIENIISIVKNKKEVMV